MVVGFFHVPSLMCTWGGRPVAKDASGAGPSQA